MTNNQPLATLFYTIAEHLAAQQVNPYRIRAYRRAAESIGHLSEDVEEIAQRGELQSIPGVGKELAAKIREFLETGTIRVPEVTQQSLPPEVLEWTSLPGFSPPLVHYLYARLHIETLDDLETLVRSHMLRTVPGVHVSDETLLAAIREKRGCSPP